MARGTKIITELNSELNACSGGLFWEDSPAARRIYTDDEWLMVEHGHHVTKTRMLGRFVAAPSARLDRDPSSPAQMHLTFLLVLSLKRSAS